MFERTPTINPDLIRERRRVGIGSYVVGIHFIQQLSAIVNNPNNRFCFDQKPDEHARIYISSLEDEEFEQSRKRLTDIQLDSNAHIARYQMGLVTGTAVDSNGNKFVRQNSDFVVATHYLGDVGYRDKLNANIGIDQLIVSGSEGMDEFYIDRAKRNLDAHGSRSNIRSMIGSTIQDISYWLQP